MLTNETTSKLHEMHLGAMAEAFTVQMNDTQDAASILPN